MSLVVVVLLGALVVGRLRGGSLDRLEELSLRRPALVVAALLAQATGTVVGGPLHAAGLAASAVLVGGFLAVNRGVRGTGLVALGLSANALVVGLNGAMPVSPEAAARVGLAVPDLLDGRHELAAGRTRLAPLGDVVPVPLPLRPEVVSPGDVLVAAGLGQLLVLGMTSGGGRRPQPAAPVRPVVRPGSARGPGPRPARPAPAPASRPRSSRGRS